jgi:hypothetical protein
MPASGQLFVTISGADGKTATETVLLVAIAHDTAIQLRHSHTLLRQAADNALNQVLGALESLGQSGALLPAAAPASGPGEGPQHLMRPWDPNNDNPAQLWLGLDGRLYVPALPDLPKDRPANAVAAGAPGRSIGPAQQAAILASKGGTSGGGSGGTAGAQGKAARLDEIHTALNKLGFWTADITNLMVSLRELGFTRPEEFTASVIHTLHGEPAPSREKGYVRALAVEIAQGAILWHARVHLGKVERIEEGLKDRHSTTFVGGAIKTIELIQCSPAEIDAVLRARPTTWAEVDAAIREAKK